MPDRRTHRGPHPADSELFAPRELPGLRAATRELSWLLGRDYAVRGGLKLVGDRHGLRDRQRAAVLRSACSDRARDDRLRTRLDLADVAGRPLVIDGFNCVITVEAALSGGLILLGRDGCCRDLSSVHGSYRQVAETTAAVRHIVAALQSICPAPRSIRWLLDRPVSNSGRLRQLIADECAAAGLCADCELCDAPDRVLRAVRDAAVATSDSAVLDQCPRWVDLPEAALTGGAIDAWQIDMGAPNRDRPRLIISGGQTGADRGGLDAAIDLGIAHGGACPRGRRAEDGSIPLRYALLQTDSARYEPRTRRNVMDSDGTALFTRGPPTGGSALTEAVARRAHKPLLHLDLDQTDEQGAAQQLRDWLANQKIQVLNVAGSRESGCPGLAAAVRRILISAVG
jgi:hypothetical protein